MRPVVGVVLVGAVLVACASDDGDVITSLGATAAVASATVPASAPTTDAVSVPPVVTAQDDSTALRPTSVPARSQIDPPVTVVANDLGDVLDRVSLADYGIGGGVGDLGFADCAGCAGVGPASPLLSGPGVGDVIIADVVNERWQSVRGGVWSAAPFTPGERLEGAPIQATDGYVYAVIDSDGSRRVDALSPFDLSWAASYPLADDESGVLHQINDEIRYGDTFVTTVQRRPELPMWSLDVRSNRLTLRIVDVERVFVLPPSWAVSPTEVARLDDGTVIARATVPRDAEPPISVLVRFWLDGSYATGTVDAPSVTIGGTGHLAEAGWVQLDDAISLYPFPDYDGPDPLTGWAAPPFITPDLDAVPKLLPVGVAEAPSTWLRSEGSPSESSVARAYVQLWARAGEDGVVTGLVEVETGFTFTPFNPSSTPVDVAGWPIARSARMGSDDFAHITLQHADRFVSVWSLGLGEVATLQLAKRLAVDVDGEGWTSPIETDEPWVPIAEGWQADHLGHWLAGNTADGRRFELSINRFAPSAAITPLTVGGTIVLTSIRDRPALLFDRGDVVGLTFAPAPDTVVVIGAEATADELIDVAEAIVEVDGSTWDSLTSPDPSTDDGCNSFFC